jgi:hypothetical protein
MAHADGGDPAEDLRQAWLELADPVTTYPQAVAAGQGLIRSWAEPARRYHTLAHLSHGRLLPCASWARMLLHSLRRERRRRTEADEMGILDRERRCRAAALERTVRN